MLTIVVNIYSSLLMKFCTKTRYGIRVLLELALCQSKGPLLMRDISMRQRVPLPYLQRLIKPLVKAGLIKTTRGMRGGLSLGKHPKDIMLIEAVQILEGPVSPVRCVENPQICKDSDQCAARDIWGEVKTAISTVLESLTLQALANRHINKHAKNNCYQSMKKQHGVQVAQIKDNRVD